MKDTPIEEIYKTRNNISLLAAIGCERIQKSDDMVSYYYEGLPNLIKQSDILKTAQKIMNKKSIHDRVKYVIEAKPVLDLSLASDVTAAKRYL